MPGTERVSIDDLLASTPYLVADGEDAVARFGRVAGTALNTHARAIAAAEEIGKKAERALGPYESAIRSELVAESNRMEGYRWSATEVRDVVRMKQDLMEIGVDNFIAAIRDDERLWEALGLYKAYDIADDWARGPQRPREFELRALHSVVMPTMPTAGRYKQDTNEIGGSAHTPLPPWDTPRAMQELMKWFDHGSGDPVLDAAIGHAWLTHIHPFDDGNGRMARLIANLALIQAGFPPLLLRSGADREMYLDALAASDDGDILPLYDLFARSLRRVVRAMEHPDYVRRKIESELLATVRQRRDMWRTAAENFATCLEHKARRAGWSTRVMGTPSLEDFEALEQRNSDGNCWFMLLGKPVADGGRWLLWVGYRSGDMVDALGDRRAWPSIFVSERTDDPRAVHPFVPLVIAADPRQPLELSIRPGHDKEVTVRRAYEVEEVDLVDAADLVVKYFCR